MTDETSLKSTNLPRRSLLKAVGGGVVASALGATLSPNIVRAQQDGAPPNLRRVSRLDRQVTALGLGTFLTFDLLPGADRTSLREVMQIYIDAGVRVIDTSPLYGAAEQNVGVFLAETGLSEEVFVSNKLWTTGDFLADNSQSEESLALSKMRLWRNNFDVMFCHNLVNIDVAVPQLNAWKADSQIGLVGISHHENLYHDIMTRWIERGQVDAVQVNYSIFNSGAADRLLPAAEANGVTVFANLVMEKGRLPAVTENVPLPEWAAEIGAETWSQVFVKWVMADPRITVTLTATSDPDHARENARCLSGPLPDAALRNRMRKDMEAIPGFADIGSMPWYPGKEAKYQGLVRQAQTELRESLGG